MNYSSLRDSKDLKDAGHSGKAGAIWLKVRYAGDDPDWYLAFDLGGKWVSAHNGNEIHVRKYLLEAIPSYGTQELFNAFEGWIQDFIMARLHDDPVYIALGSRGDKLQNLLNGCINLCGGNLNSIFAKMHVYLLQNNLTKE